MNTKKTETKSLGSWCISVRKAHKNGKLSHKKIKRLEALGFICDVLDNSWHTNHDRLKIHIQRHGWDGLCTKNAGLFSWVSKQRADYKNKRLTEDKIMLLNRLGINWLPMEDSWDKMLREFEKYRQEYRCSTVSNKDKSYPGLYTWCFMQRKNYRENKMPEDKFTLLNNAGFQWNLKER